MGTVESGFAGVVGGALEALKAEIPALAAALSGPAGGSQELSAFLATRPFGCQQDAVVKLASLLADDPGLPARAASTLSGECVVGELLVRKDACSSGWPAGKCWAVAQVVDSGRGDVFDAGGEYGEHFVDRRNFRRPTAAEAEGFLTTLAGADPALFLFLAAHAAAATRA